MYACDCAQCDQQAAGDDASPTNQEPRLLHRLLRGELDERDIQRAAEQAAAAAAAAAAPECRFKVAAALQPASEIHRNGTFSRVC